MPVNHDDFLSALIDCDWPLAERLLEEGADMEKVVFGKTPLLLMAGRGHARACSWLLEHGASGSARTPDGFSALHLALDIEHVRSGPETIDALLDGGAAPDLPDNLGTRPLAKALALRRGDHAATRLIAAGVDINAASHLGTTPLLVAATAGKKDFVLGLLKAGADPSAVTSEGRSLLYAIIEGDDSTMLADVLGHLPRSLIDQPNRNGTTPMGLAAHHGNLSVISLLLDAGADPNAVSVNRFSARVSPLMILAMADFSAVGVAKAIAAGADVSMRTTDGESAVAFAARSGNTDALLVLAKAGADMAALDRYGLSPYTAIVAMATQKKPGAKPPSKDGAPDYMDIIRELHQAGCPFESVRVPGVLPDEDQPLFASPLALACSRRAWDMARFMVGLGARPDALGPDGESPLHVLARVSLSPDDQTVFLLLRQGAARGSSSRATATSALEGLDAKAADLLASKAEEQVVMLGSLLDAGASPDVVNARGFTPLALAVRGHGDEAASFDKESRIVSALLRAGADPWLAGPEGEPAMVVALATGEIKLFHAMWNLHKDDLESRSLVLRAVAASPPSHAERERFLDLLQSMGPGPWLDHADADGNTPLIYAAATGQTDVVVALLALGANPDVANAAGETALMHAIEQHRGDIVAALRVGGADLEATRPDGARIIDLVGRLRDDYVERAFKGLLDEPVAPRVLSEAFHALREEGEALAASLAPPARRPRP